MSDSETPAKPIQPPEGLVKRGRKDGPGRALWKQIVTSGKYLLRPDELRILEDACRMYDRADDLQRQAADRPSTVRGSTGQPVINPLLAEERQCRLAAAQLLKQLKLPDELGESAGAGPRSVNARNAAQARWNKTG